jgi:hypothetical protein
VGWVPWAERAARTATIAAIALASGAGAATAAAALPPGAAPYGLTASNANFVPGKTLAERTASYRRLYRAGVRAIRVDINWVQVEPPGKPRGDYNFADRDREVHAIRDAGLKVIGILAYGHPDYSSSGTVLAPTPASGGIPPFAVASAQYFPPDDPRDFAHYARTVATHYGNEVLAWEVWNEENEGWRFWPPREDPAAYARLLCAAHTELKAADPGTPVLFGGLFFPAVAGQPGMSATQFVDAAYAADPKVGRCYDAMAYHPYPYPFTAPELDAPVRGSVLSAAGQMREALRRNGDGGKPLWITEVGWPTHDMAYGVSEEKQAQYVARMSAATFAQGLPVLTWYTYGDYQDPTHANQEAWFGFFRPDGSPKPSYAALTTFARTFSGARFEADRSAALGLPGGGLLTGGRAFALEYRRAGARVTALWYANESAGEGQGQAPPGGTADPAVVPVDVPVASKRPRLVGYLGDNRAVTPAGGKVHLDLGPSPVYLVDRPPYLRLRLRCAGRALVAHAWTRPQARRVEFSAGGRRFSDTHAPFRAVVARGGSANGVRVGAAALLLGGGSLKRSATSTRGCGAPR